MESIKFNSVSSSVTQSLSKQIQKAIDIEINEIFKQIKKQIPQKLTNIRSEILLSFQTIAFTEVQKVFLETYGENYDVDSLNDSLQLGLENDLRPIFLYNKQAFHFNRNLKNNQRKFNWNSISYASFGNGLEDPDFYSEDEYILYEDDNNPYDEITEENLKDYKIFQPYNRINRQGGYASLEETYQKAKNDALDKFEKEYITHIKPRIVKKYGLKI